MKTAQEFIDFFSAIPEDKWCEGQFDNFKGQKCALGHLGRSYHEEEKSEEAANLEYLFKAHNRKDLIGDSLIIPWINDGSDDRFNFPTPKQRILAALELIKEAGL